MTVEKKVEDAIRRCLAAGYTPLAAGLMCNLSQECAEQLAREIEEEEEGNAGYFAGSIGDDGDS